jgi:glycerol-3-phosphate acyltransferase PlsY
MEYFLLVLLALGTVVSGYLFGSVSWAVIVTKYVYHVDIYQVGSRNAGGTNVGRACGKKAAIAVIILDILKCLTPFWVWFFLVTMTPIKDFILSVSPSCPLCLFYYPAAFGAGLGHVFPIYYHFKGGKAVSCFGGFVLGSSWFLFAMGLSVFGLVLGLRKRVSLASIVGTIVTMLLSIAMAVLHYFFPAYIEAWVWFYPGPKLDLTWIYAFFVCLFGAMVLILHRVNMVRLAHNKEPETHFLRKGEKPVAHFGKAAAENKENEPEVK